MIPSSTHNGTMVDPHIPLSLPDAPRRWVACLCADWCGTCRDYRQVFDQVQTAHPGVSFLWMDIEDDAELAGDLDIETFPTVLVGEGGQLLFAGPLLPHVATLSRLLSGLDSAGPAVADPAMKTLAAALQQRLISA